MGRPGLSHEMGYRYIMGPACSKHVEFKKWQRPLSIFKKNVHVDFKKRPYRPLGDQGQLPLSCIVPPDSGPILPRVYCSVATCICIGLCMYNYFQCTLI